MAIRAILAALFSAVLLPWLGRHAEAQVVNPAQPITHEVNIQLIQTTSSDGSDVATVFGDEIGDISERVNSIWAQCGIRVNFLDEVNVYANDFAFDGSPSNFETNQRPTSDLGRVLSNGDSAGAGNSDPEIVDVYFVDIVPGFSRLGDNFVAGLARVDGNGITMLVSDSLLTFDNGLRVVSTVFAHELGHNLGLEHLPADTPNLLATSGGTGHLTSGQCDEVFDDRRFSIDGFDFLQELEFAPCDLDGDGRCDLADLDSLYETFDPANTSANQTEITAWLDAASDINNPAKDNPADVYVVGDLDLNGSVDSSDLGQLLNVFGSSTQGWDRGDLNADNVINSDDLGLLLNSFGHESVAATSSSSVSVAVPEPTGAAGFVIALFALVFPLRRRINEK